MDEHWSGFVTVNAPVGRVCPYLADFPKHCEWAQTLERMEQKKPGAANGVGAVYKTSERQGMQADRAPRGPLPAKAFKGTTQCEVTELLPDQRIAWKAHPVPMTMGFHAELAFDLQPEGTDRTRLQQTIAMHQPWLPYHLFRRFIFKLTPEEMKAKAAAQRQASLQHQSHPGEPRALRSRTTFAEGVTMDILDSSRPVLADSHPLSRRGALARAGAGAAALAFAARAIPTAAQESSSETNEGIVRKLYAAYNAGSWEALAAVIAVDAVDHDAVPGQAPGLAGLTQQLMTFKAAFTGAVVVDELVSETVWVTDRIHLDGTHTGDFFGIPATGNAVHIEAIEMWKTKDGKIVEGWHVENLLQVLIQLGAIAAPGGASTASPVATPAS